MTHRVCLTHTSNHIEAWVVDLPGCLSSPQLLPVAIAEHRAWLAGHGEAVSEHDATEVVEKVHVSEVDAPDGEFCFAADTIAVSNEDIEAAIRRLGYARNDLLAVTDGLPNPILDWEPPLSAMAHVHPWAPEVRSIRRIVQHVASTDGYYRHGLTDGDVPQTLTPDFELQAERESLLDRIRSLTKPDRSRIFRPKRPWRDRPEEWTLRKVIRRGICHERFHTAEIRQRLGWVLLGVPDFTTTARALEGASTG